MRERLPVYCVGTFFFSCIFVEDFLWARKFSATGFSFFITCRCKFPNPPVMVGNVGIPWAYPHSPANTDRHYYVSQYAR